jgi:hypothetical protein
MINGHDLERLIELAFDYVSAETEQQANQVYDRAAMLATETTTFKAWLELVEYIKAWNSDDGYDYPMPWASALQFFSTRQAKVEPMTGEEPASNITIDLIKLIEQAVPQVIGAVDSRLLLQWLARNSGSEQMVTIDLVMVPITEKTQASRPTLPNLQVRINDVITFSDDSELRIHVVAPRGRTDDLATDAYYGLLPAISNIQANTNETNLKNLES